MPVYIQLFEWEKKKVTVHKSRSLNLLVHRTKSMVKLITFRFPFIAEDEFLSSNV